MLKLMFCTNDKFKNEFIDHTSQLIRNSSINAKIELVIHNPVELVELLKTRKDDDEQVVILCDSYNNHAGTELALEIRSISHNAYIIYCAANKFDLPEIINNHIRPSGFLNYTLDYDTYGKILKNIYSHYASRDLDDDRKFTLIVGKQLQTFFIEEIIFFESLNKRINMRTINAQMSFYDTLSSLEERLAKDFMRCHNSYLVNVGLIEKISLKDLAITLRGGIKIPVSQSYKENVIKFIQAYKEQLTH